MSATDPETPALAEARRAMEICNACRYCEGYCPVFPAMERRRAFAAGDLGHLANLCHNCQGCWHACQYAPPHEFMLNLPVALSALRAETYAAHAWPRPLGRLFERNGLVAALALAAGLALALIGAILWAGPETMVATHRGPGAFYAVIPYEAMVGVGGAAFLYAILAMGMGARSYWRASGGGRPALADLLAALRAAATTRHLAGAGEGCNDLDDGFSQARRWLHLATMWGFLLCFAATSVATLMDHLLGWVAPYSWHSAPVVLGTVGGVGLLVGPAGLFAIKLRADPAPQDRARFGMDYGFLALLFLTSATGLALLFFRHTSAMGWLLAIHLGVVLALFATLPYGKFVHGIYRLLALLREAGEARTGRVQAPTGARNLSESAA